MSTYANKNGLLEETQPIPAAPVVVFTKAQIDQQIIGWTQSVADSQANLVLWQTRQAQAISLGVTK